MFEDSDINQNTSNALDINVNTKTKSIENEGAFMCCDRLGDSVLD